jgi:hypothetical protein
MNDGYEKKIEGKLVTDSFDGIAHLDPNQAPSDSPPPSPPPESDSSGGGEAQTPDNQ